MTGGRVTLGDALASPESKARYVRRLFSTIADHYDLITILLSFGLDRRWKRRVVDLAAPAPGRRALDLACGTGDIAFGLARRGAHVVGLDITHRMLQLGRDRAPAPLDSPERSARSGQALDSPERSARSGQALDSPEFSAPSGQARTPHSARRIPQPAFVTADMMALPFAAAEFDIVTTGYGLRNVPDLRGAIREIHRVLRPGGVFISLDFNRPANPVVRAVYLGYLWLVGGALGWVLHRDPDTYRYIPASIRRYPGASPVAGLIRSAGFTTAEWRRVLGGLMAIHVAGK